MRLGVCICAMTAGLVCAVALPVRGQQLQYPQVSPPPASGLRDAQINVNPNVGPMVPLNPATSQGIYPSTGLGSPLFDPYATRPSYQNPGFQLPSGAPGYGQPYGATVPGLAGNTLPGTSPSSGMFGNPVPNVYAGAPYGVPNGSLPPTQFPSGSLPSTGFPNTGLPNTGFPGGYSGNLAPNYPGAGQSGSIGNYSGGASGIYPPGMYPNTSPPSLFPTSIFGGSGGMLGGLSNWLGGTNPYGYAGGAYNPGGYAPGYGGPVNNAGILAPGAIGSASPYGNWNPQGSLAGTWGSGPQFIRFFQGPRFRHAFIYGDNDQDSLQINDSDLSLAFAVPNFLFSTQPLYILPSFSLHQWDGPNAPASADLPSKAYSAFLDSGWQTDPLRLLGAELGVRVGVFSDFNTFTSDSLRVQGRALARMRLTPTATLKGGVMYLDRNRVKLLPAGGVLWQPNPGTRFDLFFPEPKLAHYLNTVGTYDTWWYVGGYYGGGAWTVERADGTNDSIDINDIRLLIGMEWGRNDQLRDGRRIGFLEAGYVFNRELLYKNLPADNLDLDDSFVVRAGIGY
ncbi:MAG: hypothetical protein IT423_03800 [Pirellulaceae bacterium]|nr:hypothetical protein [Pirellulaceae bacterium]